MAYNPPEPSETHLDDAMTKAAAEINAARSGPGHAALRPNEPPEHRFMVVTDHLIELLLDTARTHLTRAENNMKRVELEVAALKARSKEMWDELESYNKELDAYSHESISIHERFLKRGTPK
jgi:hypothetical protein